MIDVSKSLRSLTKNERIAYCVEQIAHSLFFLKKTGDSLRKTTSEFPILGVAEGLVGLVGFAEGLAGSGVLLRGFCLVLMAVAV